MKLVPIASADLPLWDHAIKQLLATLPEQDAHIADIMYFLRQKFLQAWLLMPGPTGVLITEIVHHPRHSVLVLKYGAGKLPANYMKLLREVVYPWAKTYGCSKVEVAGRKGWKRMLGLTQDIPVFRGEL